MSRKYSLALHDVRVSWAETAVTTIKQVMNKFDVPLTVHLIFDQPLEPGSLLASFIIENVKNNRLEIVFHGLTHQCSKNVSKLLVFYHKYQAEYLNDTDLLRDNTASMFRSVSKLLDRNLGICPPCWIAKKNNFQFFKTLSPLYIESILFLTTSKQKWFSPVISLGSLNKSELFFLKILAKLILHTSLAIKSKRIRVAIHTCDLENPSSLNFFSKIKTSLNNNEYIALILSELIA